MSFSRLPFMIILLESQFQVYLREIFANLRLTFVSSSISNNTEPHLNNDLNRFLWLPAAVLIAALAGGGEDILVGRQQQI